MTTDDKLEKAIKEYISEMLKEGHFTIAYALEACLFKAKEKAKDDH
jgi:hypothetical protein